ncbi:hypothetical protein [Shewanella gaetbuli]|uniref:Uncharacterized protein n=1 Tax=Shewanella gaetbuli TaxID=220752 RepID=A0A9X1ZY59_9GAMM|nr:hypothetical protein [Shewanella gaetbuli]MCL1144291.1 hypothetical protein [Shewanella gaetbuli]
MNYMDITLALLLIGLFLLHIMFCYRALTTTAHISNIKRWFWGGVSLLMGPLGYYVYQNLLPLESLE